MPRFNALQALRRLRIAPKLSQPRTVRLNMEALEARCMLSASPLSPDSGFAGPVTPPGATNSVPGELLVGFNAGASDQQIRGLYRAHGLRELEQLYSSERVHRVAVPDAAADAVMRALEKNPLVAYAEPNHVATASFTPNDPFYSYQWHLANSSYGGIQVDKAWDTTSGAGAVVAVLDTGVAYENYSDATGNYYVAPDLAETRFTAGYDFINGDPHANDDHSHGTHVAGTIAQNTNNGQGAAGVAFGASIMPVKVLSKDGSGSYSAIANGIRWAADNGAHVINMSLGASSPSTTLRDALAYAHGKGITIVAAAGNDGQNAVSYPAAYDAYVIAVSATRFDERLAGYSNFGSSVDLAAPGGDVRVDQNGDGQVDGVLQNTFNPTTKNTSDFGYYLFQGTSMAAPHVAGVAALIVSQGVTNPDHVRAILESSAEDKGTAGVDIYYGHGIVNAAAALASLTSTNTAPVAGDDTASTAEDTPVVISVLANDSDADSDPLVVSAVTSASNGSVVINSNNTLTYTPKANYNGSDSLSYTVSDGQGGSDTAVVSILVAAVNDAPVARNDSATSAQNTALPIDVLANDSDLDGDVLSISSFAAVSKSGGTITNQGSGTLTYTPPTGFIGTDTFTYTASDGNGGSATATVTVTVQAPSAGPPGINFLDHSIGSYGGSQDAGTAIVEDGGATLHIKGNAWKQIALPYQITADTILEFDFRSPAQGEIHTIGFDQNLRLSETYGFTLYGTQSWGRKNFRDYAASAPEWKHYQIPVGQFYTGTFEYLFFGNDNDATSANGEGYFANVKVYEPGAITSGPSANNDTFTVSEDSSTTTLDVLANDSTDPAETLTITSVSTTSAGGSLTIVNGTSLAYQPRADFFGQEIFTYTVNDGTPGNNATATVTATVAAINDAPTAKADTFTIPADSSGNVLNVLANDSILPDSGETLSITAVSAGSAGGTASIVNGVELRYTPAAGFSGQETFTYTINDGTPGSDATATVTVTVQDAPDGSAGINFLDHSIGSYGGSQDAGTATVEDGGATLHLTGNGWKQIAFPYQVTADTILEFDFRSPVQGEIHTIGFDQNLRLSETYGFTLYGTQSWGRKNFRDYAASAPEWKHYQIPVGQFYTGTFEYLFFGNDNDATSANGEGYFANVKVYESGTSTADLFTSNDVPPSYHAPDSFASLAAATTDARLDRWSGNDSTPDVPISGEANTDVRASSQPLRSLSAPQPGTAAHGGLATDRDAVTVESGKEQEGAEWSLRVDELFSGDALGQLTLS